MLGINQFLLIQFALTPVLDEVWGKLWIMARPNLGYPQICVGIEKNEGRYYQLITLIQYEEKQTNSNKPVLMTNLTGIPYFTLN